MTIPAENFVSSEMIDDGQWVRHPSYRRRLRRDGIIETIISTPLQPDETATCIAELAKFCRGGEVRELVRHESTSIIASSDNRIHPSVKAAEETFSSMKSVDVAFVASSDFAFALCRQLSMSIQFPNTKFLVTRDPEEAERWLTSRPEPSTPQAT